MELARLSLELTRTANKYTCVCVYTNPAQEQIPDAKPPLVLSTKAGCSVQPSQQVALSHTFSWSLPPFSQGPTPWSLADCTGKTEAFLAPLSKK